VIEVKSFHKITSFYKKFVNDFSAITAPLIKIVKESIDLNGLMNMIELLIY
jgi:hypothetical protein